MDVSGDRAAEGRAVNLKEDGGKAVKATKKRTDGKAHKAAEEKNTLPHLFRQLG